ncbi:MAG: amino acid transporter substrate-binding protein [Mucilaginibacter sp.]|nr:amino acid transporter substrate-binding protein [Mucilaginibacter sp.]
MISVRNHRPLLSGNKRLLFLFIALVAGACSPKLRPAPAPVKQPEKPATQAQAAEPVKSLPKTTVISLLLPFGLDNLNPGANYTANSLKQADLALDYYQGFKLALDSLTALGYNYKLQLYDSNGELSQAHSLAYNPQVRASDLIAGPVFPEEIKAFTSVLTSQRKPILSPLSPSEPAAFKNQNLITVIPPLDCHASAAAEYINNTLKPKKIFILKSGYSDENKYIVPFKKAIDSLSKKHVDINQFTVVRGQLTSLVPQLSLTEQNVFVVPSTNEAFLMVTLRSLDSLANQYPITVFGHPSWEKFSFLKAQLLQHLNTHITSSDRVNYKAQATVDFLNNYRKTYHIEPTDYAIKGFDEGLYFGRLLGANANGLKDLSKNDFTGMHNSFHFIHKPGLGWINTHVNIYQYVNFELKPVE